jgi:putative glycerol-1-phosphate prenyltransferase
MVKAVSSYCSIPVIVGGGIKSPKEAADKVKNGAKIIVTGNFFENEKNWGLIKDFADSVHNIKPVEAGSFKGVREN